MSGLLEALIRPAKPALIPHSSLRLERCALQARGSATQPATAEAAATAGEAKMTSLVTWPIRPTKLRLVVETVRSPSAITPMCPPRQGPQVGVETAQPAWMKVWISPSFMAWSTMSWVAGMTMQRTPSATFLPWNTAAAARRSLMRPLVQEPMTTC